MYFILANLIPRPFYVWFSSFVFHKALFSLSTFIPTCMYNTRCLTSSV